MDRNISEIKISFIGCGNMAGAIIKSIAEKQKVLSNAYHNIGCFDVYKKSSDRFVQLGATDFNKPSDAVNWADIIFLTVKPQQYEEVLIELKGLEIGNRLIITVAPGITTDFVRSYLGKTCKVIRTMPNTPILVGQGAVAVCCPAPANEQDYLLAKSIFEPVATVELLDESQMDAVVSVNGSSPAYIYLFAKAVIDNAAKNGIDPSVALNLFAKTLEGSATMLTKSGHSPEELIEMVSSKGGTTIEALEVLYKADFTKIISEAMDACTKRAKQLRL